MTESKTAKDGIEPTEQSHYEEATPETACPICGGSSGDLSHAMRCEGLDKPVTAPPQKFRVHFKWAKIERGSYEVYAADEEQAQSIAKAMFRDKYTPECRLQEFTTVETVTK